MWISAFADLAIYEKEFLRRKSQFAVPTVHFDGNADVSRTSPPELLYNSNAKFLEHLDWVSKTIEDMDALDMYGNPELRSHRKAIIMDMQEHQNFLDQAVLEAWELTKLQSKSSKVDPTVPKIIDTCKIYLFHTRTRTFPEPQL